MHATKDDASHENIQQLASWDNLCRPHVMSSFKWPAFRLILGLPCRSVRLCSSCHDHCRLQCMDTHLDVLCMVILDTKIDRMMLECLVCFERVHVKGNTRIRPSWPYFYTLFLRNPLK